MKIATWNINSVRARLDRLLAGAEEPEAARLSFFALLAGLALAGCEVYSVPAPVKCPGTAVGLFTFSLAYADAGSDAEAIGAFLAVESEHASSPLAPDASRRLAALYEKSGNPLAAAERLANRSRRLGFGVEPSEVVPEASETGAGVVNDTWTPPLKSIPRLRWKIARARIETVSTVAESPNQTFRFPMKSILSQSLIPPPEVPMTSANVLVALAMTGGVPKKRRAGKVTRVPPPATALMAPPAIAAIISPRISVSDILGPSR